MTKLTHKQTAAKINGLKKRFQNLESEVQNCLISCVEHTLEHNDTDLISRLAKALPKSARGRAFVQVIEQALPLTYGQNKNGENMFRLQNTKNGKKLTNDERYELIKQGLQALKDTPWHEWASFKEQTQNDIVKLLSEKRALKRLETLTQDIEKTIANASDDYDKTELSHLQALQEQLASIRLNQADMAISH